MACIQREERERINKFVFQRDAKLALVSACRVPRVVFVDL
jgi:hypothetical protein